jgi:type I restriction enzyme S subunit
MSRELPADWREARLGFLVETQVPQRDKPDPLTGPIPWVRIEDFDGQEIRISKTGQGVTHEQVHAMNLRVFEPGTVLCSCSCSMGATAIVRRPLVSNQTFIGLKPGKEIDSRFLFYLMRAMSDELQARATGAIQQYLSRDDFRSLRVPLPPLSVQRRIADFLDAETARMDKLLRVRNSQLSRLEELWQARLAHRAETLIAAYGLVPLRRVITSIEQGWSPQCEDRQATNSEWAVLKTSAVSTGIFQPSQHKRLPERVKADLRFRIADGDVLMTRGSGSPDHVGVAALAKTEGRRLLLSDLLYRMRLRDDWVPEFMILMLSSKPVRSHVSLLLRGQSGQTIKLRAEDVKSIGIPATPPGSQRQIAEELKEIHDNIHAAQRAIHRSLALLTERRQSLITAAVTGQLDVSTASGRNVTEGVTA